MLKRAFSSPIRYERQLPDGSIEVFAQPDGAATFPRKVFMTEWIDATGGSNKLTYTYDASLRLVAVTDAIGQVTTLDYQDPNDSRRITKVTDPFGRYATLTYSTTGRLSSITDVIGLTSQFTYDTTDFVRTLTTPYGQTVFMNYVNGTNRWIEATDPLGATERVEFMISAPGIGANGVGNEPVPSASGFISDPGYLNYRNTFYWDRRAWSLYPGDYTKAAITHWFHSDANFNNTSAIVESSKRPLENRVWYRLVLTT